MKLKKYFITILAALALLPGCYDDDELWNAVNTQEQRIAALETWQKTANSNIEALQALVSGKHYITDIAPVTLAGDTLGYTITFNDRDPVTLYHGAKGDKGDPGDKGDQGDKGDPGSTPAISLTQQEDGNWYWTLNGDLMTDPAGNPIRANALDGQPGTPGQAAPTPMLKTGQQLTTQGTPGTWTPDALYLSVDLGKTWTQVSGRNGTNGDSFFSGVDTTSSDDYVTFTLTQGGTPIRVPRYKSASLELTPPATRPGDYTTADEPIPWNGPWLWGSSATVTCRINYPAGSTHRVEIIPPKGWKAELNTAETELTITAPDEADLSTADYEGKIIVMLHVDDNPAIIRTLDVKLTDAFRFNYPGDIATLLTRRGYKGSSLTVFYTIYGQEKMSQEDFDALKANTTIHALDLRQMKNTELPADAFNSNLTLQTILLPEGLTTIGNNAFYRCSSLREIEIPQKVDTIPPGAFYGCYDLQKVTLPEGLKEIQGRESLTNAQAGNQGSIPWGAFARCPFLTDLTIPSTCEKIGAFAFAGSGEIDLTQDTQELIIPENSVLYHQSFSSYEMTKLILNTTKEGGSYTDKNSNFEPEQIFSNCWDLKEVVIGQGVTRSPGKREDFRGCTQLEKVTLPSTFTTLHPGMFADCTALKTIIWPISKADVNTITIEEGTLSDGTPNAGPFHNANPDFKIYVTGDCVPDMQLKFPTLSAHIYPIE